jgi:MFS family permease
MHLISPEILDEARSHFSFGVLGAGLSVGLLLWLFGWWGHRFWIVLTATVGGGVLGLQNGPDYHLQPVVAGLLLAISAGVLALSLVRVFAYAAGGVAAWMIVHALAPLWDQPLLCFLVGGLIGLFLFRFWTMALTSFVGTLLLLYSGLALGDKLDRLDAVGWAQDQGTLLNWLCGVVTLVGFVVQLILERRRIRRQRENAEEEQEFERESRYSRHRSSHRRAG